ncbi:MAG TPA: PAS domain-containing protein, partial [Smithellaceae bacterium]|nr:PAS domain-containing protein [Smithellaceae bacterium]
MKKKEKEDSTPPKPRIRRKAEKLLEDSEELYHLLADHMKDLVWLLDLNLNIKYISPSVEKLTGYNLNEIQNITLEKLLSKTSFDKAMKFFSAEMTKALAAPDDYVLKRSLELELSCRDGRMIWTENAFSFIRDENRKPVSILCEGRDINDRRRAEKALRESEARHRRSEERYRNILDNMEEAYYEVDLKGDLTFFNATAVTNLGYSNDEMMGMNFRKYVDKENEQKVFEAFHRVFVTGEFSKGVDWELISKNGEKKPIESSISLMKDVDGNPVGFRGIIRDITER